MRNLGLQGIDVKEPGGVQLFSSGQPNQFYEIRMRKVRQTCSGRGMPGQISAQIFRNLIRNPQRLSCTWFSVERRFA